MPVSKRTLIQANATDVILLRLSRVYDDLVEKYTAEVHAIGSKIPVGGGEWMDLFFKMEGIRGIMTALRCGKTLSEAIEFGKNVSTNAVRTWNSKHEYQTSRWEKTAHNYIEYQFCTACST